MRRPDGGILRAEGIPRARARSHSSSASVTWSCSCRRSIARASWPRHWRKSARSSLQRAPSREGRGGAPDSAGVRYLLDTDTCSWLIHARPGHEGVLQRCDGLRYGDIVISAITFAELQYMVANSVRAEGKRGAIARFLLRFQVVPFGEAAATAYAGVRLALRHSPIGALDTLIAAHAVSERAAVVTGKVEHFSRVPGLVVEDWIRRPTREARVKNK